LPATRIASPRTPLACEVVADAPETARIATIEADVPELLIDDPDITPFAVIDPVADDTATAEPATAIL
jgi:hypothetical protein